MEQRNITPGGQNWTQSFIQSLLSRQKQQQNPNWGHRVGKNKRQTGRRSLGGTPLLWAHWQLDRFWDKDEATLQVLYRPNCQRINHHYLTGLSLQDYTYLMRKSSCTVTPRRESFWWSARAWSPQWRGHGLGSGTFRFSLKKTCFLKNFSRILVDRCTMTICLASPMGHRPGSGDVADMVPFIESIETS